MLASVPASPSPVTVQGDLHQHGLPISSDLAGRPPPAWCTECILLGLDSLLSPSPLLFFPVYPTAQRRPPSRLSFVFLSTDQSILSSSVCLGLKVNTGCCPIRLWPASRACPQSCMASVLRLTRAPPHPIPPLYLPNACKPLLSVSMCICM